MKLRLVSSRTETMSHSVVHTLGRWSDLCWSPRGCAWRVHLGGTWHNGCVLHHVVLLSLLEWPVWHACVCVGDVVMASPRSLVSVTGTSNSHPPVIKHPSFVSGLHPLLASTLSMSKLPARVLSQMGLFQNSTLQRRLWLRPVLSLWGRVSLSNGLVLAPPRKCS